ncbi:MAG TPA: hypothetical protein PLB90_11995 [Opitutaceae bacterium]|nr:hypothetical protein [Opitutaceae bacterium]
MRTLTLALLFAGSLIGSPTAEKAPPRAVTLEEIASFVSVPKLKEFLASRGIDLVQQDNATMKAYGIMEYQQSKNFGADGRLWVVFPIRQKANNATVHVSFYYSSSGYILGRSIIVENDNNS